MSLFIETSNPTFCRQKEFILNLKVVHKGRSLIDPFPANHCSAPALSIRTILLDKYQMKSFKNI